MSVTSDFNTLDLPAFVSGYLAMLNLYDSEITKHMLDTLELLMLKATSYSSIIACEYSRLSLAPATTCETRNSPPEIPHWRRKSVLNPDRSADWLTEQFCIISSTIIQCCVVQKSNGDNLPSPSSASSEIFRLSVQSVCPMFNVQSRFNASSF